MDQYHCYLAKALLSASIISCVLFVGQELYAQGAPVTFGWNSNPERNIAGYRLYYGTSPRLYTNQIDVGYTLTATVADLPAGSVYYFALTAYNLFGFESLFSNGVTYTVPWATPTPGQTPTPGPTVPPGITVMPSSLNFTGVSGGPVPAPQTWTVTTSSGGAWACATNSPWFDVAPPNGTNGSVTTVTPHTQGLMPGTYVQQIAFSAFGLREKDVVVTLTLTPPPPPATTGHDDFNRPDGDLGPNWVKDPAWGTGLTIVGNKVVTSTAGGHYWNGSTFGPNQYSQVRLSGVMGTWSGVLVRANMRPGPYYLARVNLDGTDLYSSVNGSFTLLRHDPRTWTTGDVLKLDVITSTRNTAHLTVYRNGVELFDYNDSTSFIADGQPGIGLRAGVAGMSIDDWQGGAVTEGGR